MTTTQLEDGFARQWLDQARIAIVGLGLMGGSLAMALKAAGCSSEIIGVARRQATLDHALEAGIIDGGHQTLDEGLAEAELIILAVPVRTIVEMLPRVGRAADEGAIILDLGSTKQRIVAAMANLATSVQACGGHPMCGKESSGIEVAEATLYHGATFALTPLPHTTDRTLAICQALAEAIGATPLMIKAEIHDHLVATISHLPYLMAGALVATAIDVAAKDERVWDLAASGFRDTSRLAASNVHMMLDILITNRQAIQGLLGHAVDNLTRLARLVEIGNEDMLVSELSRLQRQRQALQGRLGT